MYYPRLVDSYLLDWKNRPVHKPILLRGARQVGKSWTVRHLGETFPRFVEINFERNPEFKNLFRPNLDVERVVRELSVLIGQTIIPGETLLFMDEIQECAEAIMSLRFFKEDMPGLHVIGAGSLLEFALENLPTFGVGRIHSVFMYPMTFDEFLGADGQRLLLEARNMASARQPLPPTLYERIVGLFRSYLLVGGMPAAVSQWVETHDYLACQEVQDDLLVSYEADFPKYHKRADPQLLRLTMRSVALQTGRKFVYSEVGGGYSSAHVKKALELLVLSGLCIPVTRTAGNGLPLGAEADYGVRKMMLLDTGLMLRLLNMWVGDTREETALILTGAPADLVNKGGIAEMIAGLELMRYHTPNMRFDLYYWRRDARNSQAEIDYLIPTDGTVCPVEVKAGMKGGMKSLWIYMREKRHTIGVRCSLENFGEFDYVDAEACDAVRKITVCPLYAISRLNVLLHEPA